jgi:hypothetical protein
MTEVRRQDAARLGVPVMIPGAWEPRPRQSASSAESMPRVIPPVPRSVLLRRSMLERVWRYVMRPTDTPPY